MKKLMVIGAVLLLVGCSSSKPKVDQLTMLEEKVTSIETTVNSTNAEAMELKAEAADLSDRAEAIEATLGEIKGAMTE